jgi:amino acid permease
MFVAICSLILVLFVKQFTTEGPVDTKPMDDIPLSKWFDSVNISITSYGFFNKMFPVFAEMEQSTYKNRMLTVFLALLFCFSVYVSFAYLALNIYGNNMAVSIFD